MCTKELKELDQRIKNEIITKPNEFIVLDGIVNREIYQKQDIKVLWILKEVNDTGKPRNGGKIGWDLREMLNDKTIDSKSKGWLITYSNIAKFSYGIQNNFKFFKEIPDAKNNQDVIDALKGIAVINLKKVAGGSGSNNSLIRDTYKKYSELIHQQIELIQPDVIIGGHTLRHLRSYLGLDKSVFNESEFPFQEVNGRLHIAAYHPNQRFFKHNVYVDTIVGIIKEWRKNKH